jgi:hypothetical protein
MGDRRRSQFGDVGIPPAGCSRECIGTAIASELG